MIHLTNDAVQKKGEDFGKHEDSNKVTPFLYFSLALIIFASTSKKLELVLLSLIRPTNK